MQRTGKKTDADIRGALVGGQRKMERLTVKKSDDCYHH
jgi:hypothetical protein